MLAATVLMGTRSLFAQGATNNADATPTVTNSVLSTNSTAAETDISQTRLSLLEREIVMPTDAERAALAKALGVPASTLFRSVTTPARAGAPPELAAVKP